MGREIAFSHFRQEDFHRYERCLVREMSLLQEYFRTGRFSDSAPCIGLEVEMWLTDVNGQPQPRNAEFLQQANCPFIVPELSKFNVEFNVPHQSLQAGCLAALERELGKTWAFAEQTAHNLDLTLVAIGILPTVQSSHLNLQTMSELSRFRALNEQVRRLRKGRPIRLAIDGPQPLRMEHDDVMLEAAATSLQVHFQIPLDQSVRYYNAATIASGPVIGVSANSPYLFGKRLWAESRIPLFEASIDLGGPFPRVHFGSGYAMESLEEFFLENRSCHPVLLPIELDEPAEMLPHVRLHNGTIWRWNRPLIGFNDDGRPHLRIEHRVMPAGPSLLDMLANIAFSTGLIQSLAMREVPPEFEFPFELAHQNFSSSARLGLEADQVWLNNVTCPLPKLVLEQLLPAAAEGLQSLNIASADQDRYLGVIEHRVQTGRNGATWQTEFVGQHGDDFALMTREYTGWQKSGCPVHEWH